MKRLDLRFAFVAGVALSWVSRAVAYPIPPATLWDQAGKAELIVVADVLSIEAQTCEPKERCGDVATLAVVEAWKGKSPPRLRVPFVNFICPAPARFEVGARALVFLAREEGEWSVVNLSYGTLYPTKAELPTIRDRVIEAAELQRQTPTDAQRIAWHVRAAADPATRWDGLYGLDAGSDSLHGYYDQAKHPSKRQMLTSEQQQFLADAFFAHPVLDRTFPMMLSVLSRVESQAVDQLALDAIEGLVTEEAPPWWTREVIEKTLYRLRDPQVERHIELLGMDPYAVPTPVELRKAWRAIRIDLKLPEGSPLRPEFRGGKGVGSNTPS